MIMVNVKMYIENIMFLETNEPFGEILVEAEEKMDGAKKGFLSKIGQLFNWLEAQAKKYIIGWYDYIAHAPSNLWKAFRTDCDNYADRYKIKNAGMFTKLIFGISNTIEYILQGIDKIPFVGGVITGIIRPFVALLKILTPRGIVSAVKSVFGIVFGCLIPGVGNILLKLFGYLGKFIKFALRITPKPKTNKNVVLNEGVIDWFTKKIKWLMSKTLGAVWWAIKHLFNGFADAFTNLVLPLASCINKKMAPFQGFLNALQGSGSSINSIGKGDNPIITKTRNALMKKLGTKSIEKVAVAMAGFGMVNCVWFSSLTAIASYFSYVGYAVMIGEGLAVAQTIIPFFSM